MGQRGGAALRIVLALSGGFTVYAGLNKALGGIRTLGWQGGPLELHVSDDMAFLVQDSHVRFLAGVYTGLGLLFLLGAIDPRRFRTPIGVACALILLGGFARLSQMRPEVTFGPALIGSMLAELVLMPVLWWWTHRAYPPAPPVTQSASS